MNSPRFVVTLPVKNEDWILEKSIAAASLWADTILVLDAGCTDQSMEICRRFPKVQIIPYQEEVAKFEFNRRKALFDAVRNWEGTSIVWTIDADEIVAAPILAPDARQTIIEKLKAPGTCAEIPWIMLWKKTTEYRCEPGGIWSDRWMRVVYWDNREIPFSNTSVAYNPHAPRVPLGFHSSTVSLSGFPLLHYQFAAWERTEYKQAYYRIYEFENSKQRWSDILSINFLYATTRESYDAKVSPIEDSWIAAYEKIGIPLREPFSKCLPWQVKEALLFFQKWGTTKFAWIDVWDIPWKSLFQKLKEKGEIASSEIPLQDPRSWIQKRFHDLIYFAGRFGTRLALKGYYFFTSFLGKNKQNSGNR